MRKTEKMKKSILRKVHEMGKRERETERDREREIDRETERETERKKERKNDLSESQFQNRER